MGPEFVKKRNEEVALILVQAKLLTQAAAAELVRSAGPEYLEEAILSQKTLSEAELVKTLAGAFRTQFLSTEKLAKAEIPQATLSTIPRRIAETFLIFPVLFDAQSGSAGVVTADPANASLLEEIKQTCGLRGIRPFYGRPGAVRAAIAKFYAGDRTSFEDLSRPREAAPSGSFNFGSFNLSSPPPAGTNPLDASPTVTVPPAPIQNTLVSPGAVQVLSPSVPPPARASMAPPGAARPSSSIAAVKADPGLERLVEVFAVMVSLLENERPDLRGHSATTGRFARRMAERLRLEPVQAAAIAIAGYLHDIGKHGSYHLTALNASEYAGHKLAAQKGYTMGIRLLENAQLPKETVLSLEHMYERFDGKGLPGGLVGKDIPVGARIVAVADSFSDLTQNPRNPQRRVLTGPEAIDILTKYKGSVFDPHHIDILGTLVLGDDVRARIMQTKYATLLVDGDSEETTVLELRLFEQGFDVRIARSAEVALKMLGETEFDLVISDLDIPHGDGLKLLADARKLPKGQDVAWVIYTRRQDRADAQRAFELGASDFVQKPSPSEILVQKMRALMDLKASKRAAVTKPKGVSGSLKEMGLPDMIQILYHGRKSGNLRITSLGQEGEIHIEAGNIVNAVWAGKKGEDAFYSMLRIEDGDFVLDPAFKPGERVINASSEALLLEGMRRLDEGLA